MTQSFALSPDHRGDIRVVFTLKWDSVFLGPSDSKENVGLKKDLGVFEAISTPLGDKIARHIPYFAKRNSEAARRLIDLEAIALLVKKGDIFGYIDGQYAYGFDGAVYHSGDDMTGTSGPVDETVTSNLSKLPQEIEAVALVIDSVNDHPLGRVKGVTCQLLDGMSSKVIADFSFAGQDCEDTSHLFGLLRRKQESFDFVMINQGFKVNVHDDILAILGPHL